MPVPTIKPIKYDPETLSPHPVLKSQMFRDYTSQKDYQRNLINHPERIADFLASNIILIVPADEKGTFWIIDPIVVAFIVHLGPDELRVLHFRCIICAITSNDIVANFKTKLIGSYCYHAKSRNLGLKLNDLYEDLKDQNIANDNEPDDEGEQRDYYQEYTDYLSELQSNPIQGSLF